MGNPIGAPEDLKDAVIGYQEFCDRNDWHPPFYQTQSNNLDLYKSLGFKTVKTGEERIVDLHPLLLHAAKAFISKMRCSSLIRDRLYNFIIIFMFIEQ